MMMKLEKRPISDYVLNYLRKKIICQELVEGEHLKEAALSKQLTVSRGPIREAISKLEMEGLVKTPANGRTLVQKMDEKDVYDLYTTRILLEKHALSIQNPSLLKKEGGKLYSYIDQMEESAVLGRQNIEADLNFHFLIIQMTGNRTLIQLWSSLAAIIQSLIEVTSEFALEQKNEIIQEHRLVADALLQGQITVAQQLLEAHLEGAADYFSKAIFKLTKQAS